MQKIVQIVFIFFITSALAGCVSDPMQKQMDVGQVLKQPPAVVEVPKPQEQPVVPAPEKAPEPPKEEKVIISVNNFGRANPFLPFQEESVVTGRSVNTLPPPPMYEPDPEIEKLLQVKVSGILYDPSGSSAIINVDNQDYLVHKGDMLFDYYVKDITKDKVAVKYRNNVYKAGIGEVIGEVKADPVKGINKRFGGSSSKLSYLPEVKLVTPTYTTPYR